MQIFYNRPLSLACCCFAAGTLAALFLPPVLQLILIAVFLLLFLGGIVFYCRRKRAELLPKLLILLALVLALSSSFGFFQVRYAQYRDLIDQACIVEGTVIERRNTKPYESVMVAQIDSINGDRCRTDAYIKFPYASALQVGDRFVLTGTATAFTDEHGYNEEQYALADGVLFCITCEDAKQCKILEEQPNLRVTLSKWNFALSFYLEQSVNGEAGKLASALLLGARDHLSDQTTLQFQRAGVSHLLALSGLHVSILIGFFELVLRKLKIPKTVRAVAVFLAAFAYLFFTGASPSITRAVLMFGVLTLGFFLRVPYDSFTALAAVLTLMLLLTPYAVKDLGMWMSYLATASILAFLPMLEELRERYKQKSKLPPRLFSILFSILSAVFIGIVANLGLLLLQALTFGEASLASVPATLIMSIPVAAFLVLSLFTVLLPFLAPVTAFVGNLILGVAQSASELDFVLLPLGDAFSKICLVVLTASMILIAVKKQKRVWLSCILPLAMAVITVAVSFAVSYVPNRGVCVSVVHESGGEVLLFTDRTQSVMIDFSDGTATGGSVAVELAYEQRCTTLDDLFLSHYHNRDTYFISSMASRIHVKRLHLPVPQSEWEQAVAMRLCETAERYGIEVLYGIGEHAIQALSITRFERAELPNGRHTALLFEAEVNGRHLTYANGSVLDSPLAQKTIDTLQSTDVFVLGDTGYSISSNAQFAQFTLSGIQTLLLAEERLLAMMTPECADLDYSVLQEPYILFLK